MQMVAMPCRVAVDAVVFELVDATKVAAGPDRPRHRRALDAEYVLDFVEQRDRLADLAVELVDEREDRRIAQPAHFHQLDRARFDAFRRVDHHQRGIDRRQRAVRVFREVLVAWRVEQVDDAVRVLELHDRRGHRDAALALHGHPVRRRVPVGFARLDGAGQLNGVSEQQQLLGHGGLARVGVGNDRERTPRRHGLFHGEQLSKKRAIIRF